MSSPKRCRFCHEVLAECVCDDGDMTPFEIPEGAGPLLAAMLGAGLDEPGPPYVHVLRLPETEEEMAAAADAPRFTAERDAG